MSNEPMTGERLEQIRNRVTSLVADGWFQRDNQTSGEIILASDLYALMDEVERQRAVIAEQQAEIEQLQQEAVTDEAKHIDSYERLNDDNERLEQHIAEQQAEVTAMRPIVEFVKKLVQYPGMAKNPRDLLAQAENALEQARAYVAQHPANDGE